MTIVLTAEEMKKLDAYTIQEIGVPSMVLMERAALAVVDELLSDDEFVTDKIAFICGIGNNGGDGVAAARLLHLKGFNVSVVLIGDRKRCTEETGLQLRIAEKYSVPIKEGLSAVQVNHKMNSADLIVDALFGIGLSRNVQGLYKDVINGINASPATVLSIDIPSGVSADTGEILGTAVKAHKTVVLAYMKTGLTKEPALSLAGRISVRDIGIYIDNRIADDLDYSI